MTGSTIEITSFAGGRSISVSRFETDEDFARWLRFRAQLAVWVFLDRSALVITLSPRGSSWARFAAREHELSCADITIDDEELLLLRLPSCSRAVLEDVGTDEEFARGLLWLCESSSYGDLQADQIFRARRQAGTSDVQLCAGDHEVLTCENDGRMLVWCHPSRSDVEFEEFIANTESISGFRITHRRAPGAEPDQP